MHKFLREPQSKLVIPDRYADAFLPGFADALPEALRKIVRMDRLALDIMRAPLILQSVAEEGAEFIRKFPFCDT